MANKCSHKNTTEHKDDNGHTVIVCDNCGHWVRAHREKK